MADLLSKLSPVPGSRASCKKRVGRGPGSGLGATCGRGDKGDTARGASTRAGFEGGQMPLYRRVPKRGFFSPNGVEYNVVNLRDLARFPAGAVVDPDTLRAARLVRRAGPVKILGVGELDRALTVKAHRFSGKAAERIAAAGGTIERLGPQPPVPEVKAPAVVAAPAAAAAPAAVAAPAAAASSPVPEKKAVVAVAEKKPAAPALEKKAVVAVAEKKPAAPAPEKKS
jgi:large subunit ribosomal protein L15